MHDYLFSLRSSVRGYIKNCLPRADTKSSNAATEVRTRGFQCQELSMLYMYNLHTENLFAVAGQPGLYLTRFYNGNAHIIECNLA